MGMRQTIWSQELDRIIIDNRGKLSTYLIAKLIGGGCTRNAVIGRAHRLGLEKLGKTDPDRTIRNRVARSPYARDRIAKPRIPKPDIPPIIDTLIPFEQRKTLLDLGPKDCRWPVGHVNEPGFFFCGGKIIGECSYCPAHNQRAHEYTRPFNAKFQFRRAA